MVRSQRLTRAYLFTHYSMAAILEAIRESGWTPK